METLWDVNLFVVITMDQKSSEVVHPSTHGVVHLHVVGGMLWPP